MGLALMAGPARAESSPEALTYLSCRACHADATAATAIPPIEGRPAAELVEAMTRMGQSAGDTTIMHRFVKALSPAEIEALATYVSGLEGAAQ
ncbi:c-type cytochrome [Devosia enhydra]|uniref:c-type cytochrome n=1 Tax=Devosia enhydra TaxID=665118 RepID=UPI0015A6E5E0|nr:cytochrome c [Devosia enhydra]